MKTNIQVPDNELINCISYVRVSTDIQDYNRQLDDISKYARKNDFNIIETFAEKESGKVKIRPELSKMLSYVNDSNIEFIIISELSRLGRTNEVINTIELLNSKKITLISIKESIKTLNPDKSINTTSSLLINILSGISAYELSTTKYRIKSGLERKMREGNWIGGSLTPFGYRKDENKKLVIDENEKETIIKIFDLYTQGNGVLKISRILNDEKIQPRKSHKWVDGVVLGIIRNSIYCGQRRRKESTYKIISNGKEVERLNYEILNQPELKIIPVETFEKVQQMLKDNDLRQGINRKHEYYIDNKKMICGCCGSHFYQYIKFENNDSEKVKDNRYICISKRERTGDIQRCDNYGIGISKLNKLVQNVILDKFTGNILNFIDTNESDNTINIKHIEIIDLKKDLKKLENSESKLYELFVDEMITKELHNKKFIELKTEKEKIEKKIQRIEKEIKELKKSIDSITDLKKISLDFYDRGKDLDKTIVNKIISKIVITKTESDHELYKDSKGKIVKIDIYIGTQIISCLLSQRSQYYVYCDSGKIEYLYNEQEKINKKLYTKPERPN
jgi:DNA invertase Pin-like site-specific DNA recombinase/ribosomal protein L14E/L6E/L27E